MKMARSGSRLGLPPQAGLATATKELPMATPLPRPPRMMSGSPATATRDSGMQYEVRKTPGVTEIALKGSMCFSDHRAFLDVMAEFEAPAGHRLVFNLSKLEYIDSSGLGMFLIAGDEARKKALDFRIESPKADVRRIIDLGRLDRILDIRP